MLKIKSKIILLLTLVCLASQTGCSTTKESFLPTPTKVNSQCEKTFTKRIKFSQLQSADSDEAEDSSTSGQEKKLTVQYYFYVYEGEVGPEFFRQIQCLLLEEDKSNTSPTVFSFYVKKTDSLVEMVVDPDEEFLYHFTLTPQATNELRRVAVVVYYPLTPILKNFMDGKQRRVFVAERLEGQQTEEAFVKTLKALSNGEFSRQK